MGVLNAPGCRYNEEDRLSCVTKGEMGRWRERRRKERTKEMHVFTGRDAHKSKGA